MQPSEPPSHPVNPHAPAPSPHPAPPATPGRRRGSRRTRLIIAIAAGIAALLCLGGVGIFISVYDEATQIERTAPDAVVDNFLASYLVNRNDEEASLYTCDNPDLSKISILRSESVHRENSYGVNVSITWEELTVQGGGDDRRSVTVDLTISGAVNGNAVSGRTETWSFEVVSQDGWRVCGSSKIS